MISLVVCSLLAETLLNSTAGAPELATRGGWGINKRKHAAALVKDRVKNCGPKNTLLMTEDFKRIFLIEFEEGILINRYEPEAYRIERNCIESS